MSHHVCWLSLISYMCVERYQSELDSTSKDGQRLTCGDISATNDFLTKSTDKGRQPHSNERKLMMALLVNRDHDQIWLLIGTIRTVPCRLPRARVRMTICLRELGQLLLILKRIYHIFNYNWNRYIHETYNILHITLHITHTNTVFQKYQYRLREHM